MCVLEVIPGLVNAIERGKIPAPIIDCSPLGSGKTIETVVIKIILTCLWTEKGLSAPPPIWCVFQPRLVSNLEDAIQFVTKNSYASDIKPTSVLFYCMSYSGKAREIMAFSERYSVSLGRDMRANHEPAKKFAGWMPVSGRRENISDGNAMLEGALHNYLIDLPSKNQIRTVMCERMNILFDDPEMSGYNVSDSMLSIMFSIGAVPSYITDCAGNKHRSATLNSNGFLVPNRGLRTVKMIGGRREGRKLTGREALNPLFGTGSPPKSLGPCLPGSADDALEQLRAKKSYAT